MKTSKKVVTVTTGALLAALWLLLGTGKQVSEAGQTIEVVGLKEGGFIELGDGRFKRVHSGIVELAAGGPYPVGDRVEYLDAFSAKGKTTLVKTQLTTQTDENETVRGYVERWQFKSSHVGAVARLRIRIAGAK